MFTSLCLFYQDISGEQARAQKLSAEVDCLSQELQKVKAEKKTATDSLSQSQERIESLTQSLKNSESLLQLEKRSPSLDDDAKSNSDLTNKTHICQTQTQETSPLDQSPEACKGHDLSISHDYSTGGTDRQLSERLRELENEVRLLCVNTVMNEHDVWNLYDISFAGCLCASVQLVCERDDLYYVEILALGMFDDYQLTVDGHLPQERHFYFQNYCFISVHQFL